MTETELHERLAKHLADHVSLGEAELKHVLSFYRKRTVRKRQFIVEAGDAVLHENFIVEGAAKAYLMDGEGKQHILQFGIEDWWITDWHAFLGRTPARMHVQCVEECELLTLHVDDRERLCREFHGIEHFMRMKLTGAFMSLQRRILDSLAGDAEERYRRFRAAHPRMVERFSKQDIASFLGLSRETLSRIRL